MSFEKNTVEEKKTKDSGSMAVVSNNTYKYDRNQTLRDAVDSFYEVLRLYIMMEE